MLKRTFYQKCLVVLVILKNVFGKDLRKPESEADAQQTDEVSALKFYDKAPEPVNQKRDVLWPLGVVSYYLDVNIYDELLSKRIRLAMNDIEETSCVQFRAISEGLRDASWIHITNPERVRECVHETTKTKTGLGEIVMVLGLDCLQHRDILHSLMHALGFKDEITHPDREQFVRVKWENINAQYRSLFHANYVDFPMRTTEYDTMSIMHFHDRAFTKNGQATIIPVMTGLVINPSRVLSPLDKMKLRLMFGHECNRRKVDALMDECKVALQKEGGDNQEGYGSEQRGHVGNDDGNQGGDGANYEDDDGYYEGDKQGGDDGNQEDDGANHGSDSYIVDSNNTDGNQDENDADNNLSKGYIRQNKL